MSASPVEPTAEREALGLTAEEAEAAAVVSAFAAAAEDLVWVTKMVEVMVERVV